MAEKKLDPRVAEELSQSLALVDASVDKKYVANIENMPIFVPNFLVKDDICDSQTKLDEADKRKVKVIGEDVQMLELTRFVYDEDENILDKLTAVYQAVSSYENATLFMIIRSINNNGVNEQKIYIGVRCADSDETGLLKNQISALQKNLLANFPGSRFEKFADIPEKRDNNGNIIQEGISQEKQEKILLHEMFSGKKSVAAISGVPSIKNVDRADNKQFVQGIEKVMDSILGINVDVLILAEPILNGELTNIKNGYQELFSNIFPFSKSVINVSDSTSESVTDTLTKGVTDTTNESVAKTYTHTLTQGTNSSNSVGGHVGMKFKIPILGKIPVVGKYLSPDMDVAIDYHHTTGKHEDKSYSHAASITEGISKSLSEQNSVANGLSSSYSDGLQIEYENKSLKLILEKIDKQLERIKEGEDYGMYDCGIYFLSDEFSSVIAASTAFKSIMRGQDSSVEASCINSWDWEQSEDVREHLLAYLCTFCHPVFSLHKDGVKTENGEIVGEMVLPVSLATLISGKELAIEMGMPRKSVSGIPVIKTARFGRKVLYVDEAVKADKEISLGNIYHMNNCEATDVSLNVETLTSHVFITGSTGSGKSTTVYKLLSEMLDVVDGCHFMIIEPAKGEYKFVFGGRRDVTVYGTNLYEVENILKINPFSFPKEKIHVLEHIDKLIGIFNACWPMYAAMPAILKDSIERAYIDAGWNLTSSRCKYESELGSPIYPSFADVLTQVNNVIKESQYSDDSKGDYIGALVTRLKTLTNGINGLVFSSNEISSSDLFNKNVIIDLSRISGDETKSLIMGMLLIKQQEYRVANRKGTDESLKHITILEEAHNILKRTSTEQSSEGANLVGKSVEMISNAIAEMRTYGECFIIVDQSPSAVDMSAIRNTNTKIIMRLPDISDREQIGKSAGLNDDQIVEIAKLKTGVAAIYQNNWVEPVLCQVDGKSIKRESYKITEGYEASWEGDEQIVKEIVDIMLAPFIESNYKTTTKTLLKKVLNAGIPAETKVELYEYHNSKDQSTRVNLAENIIYKLLFNDEVWKKSLAYRENIKEWYSLMKNNIKPDISDMEKEAVDTILQILVYKQGKFCQEQEFKTGVKDANDILERLETLFQRRRSDV